MKRKLRPAIASALELTTLILGIILISISDFSISSIPVIGFIILLLCFNIKVLDRYS